MAKKRPKHRKKSITEEKPNNLGIASLALGIASIVLPLPLIGIIVGIIGIVLAVKQRKVSPNGIAMAGLITSIIGVVLGVIILLMIILLIPVAFMLMLGALALQ
jgi:hypothetical protein